jgi:hypothetical protein
VTDHANVCAGCGRGIDYCAFCDEDVCKEAICYRCLLYELGEACPVLPREAS